MSNAVKNALTTIDGRLDGLESDFDDHTTQLTAMEATLDALLGLDTQKFGGVAASARTFARSPQSTVQTGAAAVELVAGTAGKKMWVTKIEVTNKTAGEYPVFELVEDAGGTPIIHWTGTPHQPIATSLGYIEESFDPPIPITAAKDIDCQLQSATGDCYAHVSYWVED